MTIRLTPEQWADVQDEHDSPPRVCDPSQTETFVLINVDDYDRQYQALFEDVPVSAQERRHQLQEFGKRAGWDDPTMDVYDDLDPRRRA
jgi:hypothetical protein